MIRYFIFFNAELTMAVASLKRRPPPAGAWDSHVHVIDEEQFPFHPEHSYRPRKATISDLQQFHDRLGIAHPCLVAVSVYHTDSKPILYALQQIEDQGRAVACIDPETTSDEQLQILHNAGIRGVRLNLKTRDDALNLEAVRSAADKIRPLRWALQLYVGLNQIQQLAPIVPDLGVTVIIDHLGSPQPSQGPILRQQGYSEFMSLLRSGLVWTKLSGVYRFKDLPDLDLYVEEILRTAPHQVVWASDWPHTGGVAANPGGDKNKLQEYRHIDDAAWVEQCWDWCRNVEGGDGEQLARKIWVDNPRRLWQYEG